MTNYYTAGSKLLTLCGESNLEMGKILDIERLVEYKGKKIEMILKRLKQGKNG